MWPYLGNGDGDRVSLGGKLGIVRSSEAFKASRLKDQGYSGVVNVRGDDWLDLKMVVCASALLIHLWLVIACTDLRFKSIETGFSEGW